MVKTLSYSAPVFNLPSGNEFVGESNEMKKIFSVIDRLARVDTAVSDLAMLNEKVSNNSWRYILANGLRTDFKESKAGVLFSKE